MAGAMVAVFKNPRLVQIFARHALRYAFKWKMASLEPATGKMPPFQKRRFLRKAMGKTDENGPRVDEIYRI